MCEMKRLCSPSKHRENTEEAVQFRPGLCGKEENSCDTRRIKPRIYQQIQKINQVLCNFLFFCADFFFLIFFSFPFCLALFLFVQRVASKTAELSGSGMCDLHEVLNLK